MKILYQIPKKKKSYLCSLYKRIIQYACCVWAALMAQRVKNPPAIRKALARSLGWEDPLEEGIALQYSCHGRIPMDRGAWRATVHKVAKSQT